MIWGKLTEESFIVHYQHPISAEGQIEWIHQDQIAFVGGDEILYAYDRRNLLLSTLLDDVGRFRLSSDCKHIAYTQGNNVFAANFYGNTISAGSKSTKELKLVAWSGAPTKQSCFFMDRDQAACRVRKKER